MSYLEFEDGKSNKFWQAEVKGKVLVVTYGRIGTDGQTKRYEHSSPADAKKDADKRTKKKLAKGYRELGKGVSKPSRAAKGSAASKKAGPKKNSSAQTPLDKKLELVSRKVLGGRAAPACLRALWQEQLDHKKNAFFIWPSVGEVRLLTKASQEAHHYLSSTDGETWQQLFEEIAWVAEEADGGILGYFHQGKKDLDRAPVILLDNEGSLRVCGRNLFDHFRELAEDLDDEEREVFDSVQAWLKANSKQRPLSAAQKKKLPDPEKRWDALQKQAEAKPAAPGRRFADAHPTCQAVGGNAVCIANEDLLVSHEEKQGEHAVYVFDAANNQFQLLPGLPIRAYLSLRGLGLSEDRPAFAMLDETCQVVALDLLKKKWWKSKLHKHNHKYGTAALVGSKVVLVGGEFYGSASGDVSVLDMDKNTWTKGPDMPTALTHAGAVALSDTKVLLFGGEAELDGDDYPEYKSLCFIYDTKTNKWKEAADLPKPLYAPKGIRLQDGRVVGIGQDQLAAIYDPKKDTWSKLVRSKLVCGPAVQTEDGSIYCFGGEHGGEYSTQAIAKLDPDKPKLKKFGETLLPRNDAAKATPLSDGRILLTGGTLFHNIACEAEIFDPNNKECIPIPGYEKQVKSQQKNLAKYRKKEGYD